MSTATLWAIIAFLVVDTVVVIAVVFWAINRNKGNQNTPNNFNNLSAHSHESPFSSTTANATGDSDIVEALRRGQKIEAIKIYRERYNVGLKEAKDAVEAMQQRL